MAAFDVLHARNDARPEPILSFDRLRQYTMDTDFERREKLLEQSPRVKIYARRILVPPILSRDCSFDNAWRGALEIAGYVMLRPLRYVSVSCRAREIEFLRTPLGRNLKEERRFLIDGVYTL